VLLIQIGLKRMIHDERTALCFPGALASTPPVCFDNRQDNRQPQFGELTTESSSDSLAHDFNILLLLKGISLGVDGVEESKRRILTNSLAVRM
jgi:hypothetical protein